MLLRAGVFESAELGDGRVVRMFRNLLLNVVWMAEIISPIWGFVAGVL